MNDVRWDMRWAFWIGVLTGICIGLVLTLMIGVAHARDLGQWKNQEDKVRSEWVKKQKMPDLPGTSCCGEGDLYYADAWEEKDGQYYAIITDDRSDEPLGRAHVDVGTKVYVPPNKFNGQRDGANPTGHGIIFLMPIVKGGFIVYCYFAPGGV